jgi:hypothetical protein
VEATRPYCIETGSLVPGSSGQPGLMRLYATTKAGDLTWRKSLRGGH